MAELSYSGFRAPEFYDENIELALFPEHITRGMLCCLVVEILHGDVKSCMISEATVKHVPPQHADIYTLNVHDRRFTGGTPARISDAGIFEPLNKRIAGNYTITEGYLLSHNGALEKELQAMIGQSTLPILRKPNSEL
jgi:hypothetical protein